MLPEKVRLMAHCLITRPTEFVDRVAGLLDRLTDHSQESTTHPFPPDAVWSFLSDALRIDVESILREPTLLQTEAMLRSRIDSIPSDAVFRPGNCAEPLLGRVAYVVCRALRPTTVLETGVAYGSSTTYLLAALGANRYGQLHSVDLPSILDPQARLVGQIIPDALRSRWKLYLGASRRILPSVLKAIGSVDVFLHDSLHTNRNMRAEFTAVTPYLGRPSVVLSDDVHFNHAFEDWARETARDWAQVRQITRSGALGIAVCGADPNNGDGH